MPKKYISIALIKQKLITSYLFFIELFWEYPKLYSKHYFLNDFFSNLWISKVFKNLNIIKFCYNRELSFKYNKVSLSEISIDYSDYKSSIEILEKYGIVVINNVLSEIDLYKLNLILDFSSSHNKLKFERTINTSSEVIFKQLSDFPRILEITKFFQSNFYGEVGSFPKNINFIKTTCTNLPEVVNQGETNPHIDKYIPALKLIYYPYAVSESDGPFRYWPYTHKTNNSFAKILSQNSFINRGGGGLSPFTEKGLNASNYVDIVSPGNSIIVAVTSGLHARSFFKKRTSRVAGFISFYNVINKLDLLLK